MVSFNGVDRIANAARARDSIIRVNPTKLSVFDCPRAVFVHYAGDDAMISIATEYLGSLRCQSTHGPSQNTLVTDAPLDNHGRGESFSPTDLVAAALGSCMATVLGIYAERQGLDLRGMKLTVGKEMIQSPVRRIARLSVEIHIPLAASHPHKEALERAAMTCPVHQSLHPDVEIPVIFRWLASSDDATAG